jgi:tetratricopeptide (TPR) repeat protein
MNSLRSMLGPSSALPTCARQYLRGALSTPWCFPADGSRDAALRLVSAPPVPAVGQALLVSVSGSGDRSSLWVFRPVTAERGACKPLGETARGALASAQRVVLRDLPFLTADEPWKGLSWEAAHLWTEGNGLDEVVDGPSYGLSMALALASAALDVPVAGDLSASAEVKPDGSLESVGSLARKVATLVHSAPGVRRLIVCPSQVEEAEKSIASHGSDMKVVGVNAVADAFCHAFPTLEDEMHRRFEDGAVAEACAQRLFFLTLGGAPLPSWVGVERAARLLLSHLPKDSEAWLRAWRAQHVAARHAGKRDVRLPWPDEPTFRSLVRGVRQRYLAHVVQSGTDGNAPDLAEVVARAEAEIPAPSECCDVDLELLGAVARAHAAGRRYPEALACTSKAIVAWIEIGQADQASHALCEHLRILGILRRADELVGTTVSGWVRDVDQNPRTTEDSRGFLRVGLARALLNVGAFEAARNALDRAPASVPDHLRHARDRAFARWLDGVGRREDADRFRDEARKGADVGAHHWLMELDVALRDDGDVSPGLEALRTHPPQGIAGLWDETLSPRDQAQRIATEYPY